MSYTINFRPVTSLGFRSRSPAAGWFDGPATTRDVLGVRGRAGVVRAPLATSEGRDITMTLYYPAAQLSDRKAAYTALLAATADTFWLGTPDKPGFYARCERRGKPQVTGISERAFATAPMIVSMPLLAFDGVSMADSVRIESVSTAGTPCPIGSGTSAPLFTLHGPWTGGTTRTITYRSATGIPWDSLTITPPAVESLASGDILEVDGGEETLTKVTAAGVRSDVFHWLAAGDFFVLDPTDALTGTSPIVAVSSGVAEVSYLITELV